LARPTGQTGKTKVVFPISDGVNRDRPDNIRPYRPLGRIFHARYEVSGLTHACCTKTISKDLAAYGKPTSVKAYAKESFSSVTCRADLPASCTSDSGLSDLIDYLPPLPSGMIDELEAAQKQDNPPADKWR